MKDGTKDTLRGIALVGITTFFGSWFFFFGFGIVGLWLCVKEELKGGKN